MKIWHDFEASDGSTHTFRRKHQDESYAGIPGVFALTVIQDFAVTPMYFAAANDLGSADPTNLASIAKYRQLLISGNVGVAVKTMRGSTPAEREQIAASLNDAVQDQELDSAA